MGALMESAGCLWLERARTERARLPAVAR